MISDRKISQNFSADAKIAVMPSPDTPVRVRDSWEARNFWVDHAYDSVTKSFRIRDPEARKPLESLMDKFQQRSQSSESLLASSELLPYQRQQRPHGLLSNTCAFPTHSSPPIYISPCYVRTSRSIEREIYRDEMTTMQDETNTMRNEMGAMGKKMSAMQNKIEAMENNHKKLLSIVKGFANANQVLVNRLDS